MKRTAIFILLLLAVSTMGAPNPDEYPISVHVRTSYFRFANGVVSQMLDVTIDGKKYRLAGTQNVYLLGIDDYEAKLIKDEHRTAYESYQVYEFLFPDKKTRKFTVVGQSE
jgi:hypothetical protein